MSDANKYTSKLSGQKILVIGGTAGIGFAVAEASIEFGATVHVSSSTESRVKGSVESIQKDYPSATDRVFGHVCNLGTKDVEANLEKLFQEVGKVDHIIFTAGDSLPLKPLQDITLESMYQAGHVRSFAALLAAKVGSKHLTHNDRTNSIIFTTGAISEKPIGGGWAQTAFFGTALQGLTRQLAFDLQPVRVNIVSPGAVDTELWSTMPKDAREAMLKSISEKMPTKVVGQSEDLAEAYLYLMRDLNITGTCISSNSGTLLV